MHAPGYCKTWPGIQKNAIGGGCGIHHSPSRLKGIFRKSWDTLRPPKALSKNRDRPGLWDTLRPCRTQGTGVVDTLRPPGEGTFFFRHGIFAVRCFCALRQRGPALSGSPPTPKEKPAATAELATCVPRHPRVCGVRAHPPRLCARTHAPFLAFSFRAAP